MKKISVILLVVAVVISISFSVFAGQDGSKSKVVAYYFHGNFRCITCHKLEQYSREAIETNFKDELASGKLEFKVVNVEVKGNEHYKNDYQLYAKSLILSLVKNGKQIKWKNLDKIWEYVSNKQRFIDYVKGGVSDLLKEAQ
ncbi:MAG: nitrophenyl compound nitroreductase subunit ArsF family protein [Candidatus Omnitrophota bacterium]